MDVICFDSCLELCQPQFESNSLPRVPQKKVTDPLGETHSVNIWMDAQMSSLHDRVTVDAEGLSIHFYFKELELKWFQKLRGFSDFTDDMRTQVRGEIGPGIDVFMCGHSKAKAVCDDIVYSYSKFVRVLVLPPGRHYLKVMGDDIEYIESDPDFLFKPPILWRM